MKTRLIEKAGLVDASALTQADAESESEAESLEVGGEVLDEINLDELVALEQGDDDDGGGGGGLSQEAIASINDCLGFDYLHDLQAHMNEDDDVNKLDEVAVAQRLHQWQSSKGAALAQACASVSHFTGVNDTSEVEEHFRRQFTLRG